MHSVRPACGAGPSAAKTPGPHGRATGLIPRPPCIYCQSGTRKQTPPCQSGSGPRPARGRSCGSRGSARNLRGPAQRPAGGRRGAPRQCPRSPRQRGRSGTRPGTRGRPRGPHGPLPPRRTRSGSSAPGPARSRLASPRHDRTPVPPAPSTKPLRSRTLLRNTTGFDKLFSKDRLGIHPSKYKHVNGECL